MIGLKILLLAGGDHAIIHKSIISVRLMRREICVDLDLIESDVIKKICKGLRIVKAYSICSITD